tara:strand:- start:244 stop:621 length:378 start_codon:yes stop_codon:yes gene_type:complete
VTHPIYDPLLSGWLDVLAAPLALEEDPLPVVLWCRDSSGWWRVIEGKTERWLTQAEARQANAALGRKPTVRPVDVGAVLATLGLSPFDAPPARGARRVSPLLAAADAQCSAGRGRVLPFALEPDE